MGNRKWLVLIAVLATSAMSPGQQKYLPDAPSHHKFWDGPNTTLFAVHTAMEATDFGITHHNLSKGGQEMNPMAKRLCESGTAGQLVFFGGRTAGALGLSYLLHKTGHHKLERAFTGWAIADSSYGVVYSFAHR
jgi:hypothetical protein